MTIQLVKPGFEFETAGAGLGQASQAHAAAVIVCHTDRGSLLNRRLLR